MISVGSHSDFSEELTNCVDAFCATHNAVVCCDHTSGYHGKYEVHGQLIFGQKSWSSPLSAANLCIHIGEVSGDQCCVKTNHSWRVSPDGELRDTFGNLRRVFMMPEEEFFKHYAREGASETEYRDSLNEELKAMMEALPELPFSNIWAAKIMSGKLPHGCALHLGILHSLRSWNFFKLPEGVHAKCNVGGFGIDGGVSAMIGASLACQDKIFVGVFGALAYAFCGYAIFVGKPIGMLQLLGIMGTSLLGS